jgi:hypothetical protein
MVDTTGTGEVNGWRSRTVIKSQLGRSTPEVLVSQLTQDDLE